MSAIMEQAIREEKAIAWDEGMRQGMQQGRLEDVRALMDALGYDAREALALLRVPESEQKPYLEQL